MVLQDSPVRERERESPTAVSFNESVATRIMPDKPAERGGSEGGKLDEERQVEAALPAGDTTMKLSSAGGTYGEAKRLAEQLGGDDLAFPTLTVRRTNLSPFSTPPFETIWSLGMACEKVCLG